MRNPGVLGSSIVSASGGFADPSTLSVRAFARRAEIASREGMFLYPTGILAFLGSVSASAVSSLSLSSFSLVSFSPEPTSLGAGVLEVLPGGDADRAPGDTERDPGGLTVTESVVDAAVEESDVCEDVRRRAAARRGRAAADAGLEPALRFIRAASWLSEGMRVPEGRSGFGASIFVVVGSEGVDMAARSKSCAPSRLCLERAPCPL